MSKSFEQALKAVSQMVGDYHIVLDEEIKVKAIDGKTATIGGRQPKKGGSHVVRGKVLHNRDGDYKGILIDVIEKHLRGWGCEFSTAPSGLVGTWRDRSIERVKHGTAKRNSEKHT